MKKLSIAAALSLLIITPITQAACTVEGTVKDVNVANKAEVTVLFDRVRNKSQCDREVIRQARREGVIIQEDKVMLAGVPTGTRVKYTYQDDSWVLRQVTFN